MSTQKTPTPTAKPAKVSASTTLDSGPVLATVGEPIYIKINKGKYRRSVPLGRSNDIRVIIDYDASDNICGVEILDYQHLTINGKRYGR